MRKIFELARSYPIESVVPIGNKGFAVCSGTERFLEQWSNLTSPVPSRAVLPLARPATRINSHQEGIYCCQNLDTLMLASEPNIQTVQLIDGVICSNTITLGNRLVHLTSAGLINTYETLNDSGLTLHSSNEISVAATRTNKPLLAVSSDSVAYQNTSNQLELFSLDHQAVKSAIPLCLESQIKDLLWLDANSIALLARGQLIVVDLRVRRISVRQNCPQSTNSIRKGSRRCEILYDSDGEHISRYRIGHSPEKYVHVPNRRSDSIMKCFDFISQTQLVVVNGNHSSLEVFAAC